MNGGVRQQNNIVLIGLSGSGKSTVGRYLATRLNYPLFDTDAVIESETGQNAADIFASRGEVAFRAIESHVLRCALEKTATLIPIYPERILVAHPKRNETVVQR